MAKDYTVFNYGTPIPQKDLNSQDRTIVAETGMNPEPNVFHPGHSKEKTEKETPTDALIMDNLETSLAITVDKACSNTNGAIV